MISNCAHGTTAALACSCRHTCAPGQEYRSSVRTARSPATSRVCVQRTTASRSTLPIPQAIVAISTAWAPVAASLIGTAAQAIIPATSKPTAMMLRGPVTGAPPAAW